MIRPQSRALLVAVTAAVGPTLALVAQGEARPSPAPGASKAPAAGSGTNPSRWKAAEVLVDSKATLHRVQREAEAQAPAIRRATQALGQALRAFRQSKMTEERRAELLRSAVAAMGGVRESLTAVLGNESEIDRVFDDSRKRIDGIEREHAEQKTRAEAEAGRAKRSLVGLERQRKELLAGKDRAEARPALRAIYRKWREQQRILDYQRKLGPALDADRRVIARARASLDRVHGQLMEQYLALRDGASDLAAAALSFESLIEHQRSAEVCRDFQKVAGAIGVLTDNRDLFDSLDSARRLLTGFPDRAESSDPISTQPQTAFDRWMQGDTVASGAGQ